MGTASEYTLRQIQTALEKIDDLQAALASVAGDELRVVVTGTPIPVEAAGDDKLFAYEDTVYERVADTNLSAANVNLDTNTVPAGKVWTLTHLSVEYTGTTPTEVVVRLQVGGVAHEVFNQLSPTSGAIYDRQGKWILKAGEYVRFRVTGATVGDDLIGLAVGYQMDAP